MFFPNYYPFNYPIYKPLKFILMKKVVGILKFIVTILSAVLSSLAANGNL